MVASVQQAAPLAVLELGAFRGILASGTGDGAEFIELPRSDLVGRGRDLWIVPSSGGRRVAGAAGSGQRFWSAIYKSFHGRDVAETRILSLDEMPASARYLGEAINIFYQPRKADRTYKRNRRHIFGGNRRPQLYATGSALFVVGGNFRITQFGIVG